jgi:hypothetical protein
MTQQRYQATQPQTAAAPPAPPTTGPTAPTPGGGVTGAGLQNYEVQFLGNILGPVIETVGPIALKWLQDRVSTMGAAAADTEAAAQEAQQFEAQFLNFLLPLLPTLIDVGGRLISGAISAEAAGVAGTQSPGVAGGQAAGTAGVADYTRG